MSLCQVDPKPVSEADDSTIYTALTPPETVAAEAEGQEPLGEARTSSSVPWPGSTFIIRATASGHVLTVLDGKVALAPPGGRGSIHWECVETKGWLGFKNVVSGKFLGHDDRGRLRCLVGHHHGWEFFAPRIRPGGGYILYMTHFERLWPVGSKVERGAEILAKIENGGSKEIVWEFIKV